MKQKPACPVIPTSDAPFSKAGTDIVLEWNVTGATQVALSLDNPGFFKTYHTGSIDNYPTKHTVDLSFQCDPTVQPNTTHKYTLDTIGGGATHRADADGHGADEPVVGREKIVESFAK